MNQIVEASFYLDFLLNFIKEYIDADTYQPVRKLSKIAKEYMFRGWFIVDAIGIFPFQYILQS